MHNSDSIISLKEKASFIRRQLVDVAITNDCGHIAPSLSIVEILVALYYGGVMNYRFEDPLWLERDRLIISKAHGAYALLAILANEGTLPADQWKNFGKPSSKLKGCIERQIEWGIEAGCGALGHGLPISVGLAYGLRKKDISSIVFCLLGDGELQEGSNWEALQFATKHKLDNVVLIIDNNRLQAMDFIENILDNSSHDLVQRLRGFGLDTLSCDGHDIITLSKKMKEARLRNSGIPLAIIAETIKGRGFKCMENVPKFHYRMPSLEEIRDAGY